MTINDTTQYKLAASIKTLMEKETLDKITVIDIVKHCGVTRQTFYRYFIDKYDLVNWYFEQLCMQSFKQMGVSISLKEALSKKFNFIKNERLFFTQAFQSHEQNSLIEYDYQSIFSFYSKIITDKTGISLSEDIRFHLEMYCEGSIHMTVQWVKSGMKLAPDKIADLLVEALPLSLIGLLKEIQ